MKIYLLKSYGVIWHNIIFITMIYEVSHQHSVM